MRPTTCSECGDSFTEEEWSELWVACNDRVLWLENCYRSEPSDLAKNALRERVEIARALMHKIDKVHKDSAS
jgi:hypothetical protein